MPCGRHRGIPNVCLFGFLKLLWNNSHAYVRWWYAVPCPDKGDLPLVVSAMDIMPSMYGPQVDDQWVRNFPVGGEGVGVALSLLK